MLQHAQISDIIVILIYIVGIFVIAYYSHKAVKNQTESEEVEEQFLAGRSLTFTESICSIIATEVSALTFLGIPAFAYSKDFSFLQIYMGALIGRIVIAFVFIPRIYGKGLTLYGIMKDQGMSTSAQRVTSLVYSITKLLAVGVRLFSGSILVAQFFNVSIYQAIIWVSLITGIYTMFGGLKAVARTDISQMLLFVFGGIVAHYVIPQIDGRTWSELISIASQNGKTNLIDISNPMPFIIGFVGGLLFDMGTHGVDQDFVQRLIACRDQKTAQKSIILSTFLSIAIGALFLGIGALLWAHYQTHQIPEGVNPDQLFAHFITNHFPSPVKGLMLAGVLAATMSTLDSTINALSSCLWNDILPPRKSETHLRRLYRIDTFIIVFLLMAVALISSKSNGLLELGLKIASWTGGGILGLFLTRMVFTKYSPNQIGAWNTFISISVSVSAVALNTFIIKGPWQMNVYFGCLSAMISTIMIGKIKEQGQKLSP